MSDSSTQRPQKLLELILACNLLTSISIPRSSSTADCCCSTTRPPARCSESRSKRRAGWRPRSGGRGSDRSAAMASRSRSINSAGDCAARGETPPTRTFASTRPRARSTTSRSARSRSPPRRSRARSRSSGRGTTTARTAGTTNEGQGVGRARVGSGARTRDEPLRRQHVVRGGHAVGLRDADPRRGNRDPHTGFALATGISNINILLTHLHLDHIQG